MQPYAIDDRSLQLIKELLKLDQQFLKRHYKYHFKETSPVGFLGCCIPLYPIFRMEEWDVFSEGYFFLTFVLYVLTAIFIGCFLQDEKRIYRFIKIIPLPFVLFLQFFTDITLFNSNKIFTLLYVIFGTLLSIFVHWKSNKKALADFNGDLLTANKRATEIIEELNKLNNKTSGKYFWWEKSDGFIEKPNSETYTTSKYKDKGNTETEITKEFSISFSAFQVNVSEVSNHLLTRTKKYVFGDRYKNMYVSKDDTVMGIYIIQKERHKTVETSYNGPSNEQIQQAKRRIDKEHDNQERWQNSNWLTHQQNYDAATMRGDKEAQDHYMQESAFSDFMRTVETNDYIRQNTQTSRHISRKNFDDKKILIGYIISGNLVIFNDSEYDKIITKLKDVIFFRYTNNFQTFEKVFPKVIGEAFSESYQTEIAATIAQVFSLCITD